MKGFVAFFEKEVRELVRTKRLMILLAVFVIVGIMNPAVAKLTPKLFELMADELSEQGIVLGEMKVTALDSWTQFVKNMPMALIVMLIMFGGIYTSEYTKGTLIPLLTKGLSRGSVVLSKLAAMLLTWSAGLWLCYGITYFYSDWYWDNSVVSELGFACFCWWLFGVLMICCIVFFSSFAGSGAQVLLGCGALYFAMTMAGMYSKAKEYLPTHLCDSAPLYKGELVPSDYTAAAVITAAISAVLVLAALPLTHRRQV